MTVPGLLPVILALAVNAAGTLAATLESPQALPELVADIGPGPAGSVPADFVRAGSRIYFQACVDGAWIVYRVDAQGPVEIADPFGSSYECDEEGLVEEDQADLAAAGENLVFAGSGHLFADDGEGFVRFTAVPDVLQGTLVSTGKLAAFFARTGPGGPVELWVSDGSEDTDHGTRIVTTIPGEPVPPVVLAFEGEIYFLVRGSDCCDGIWRSDLTPEGTYRIGERYEYSDDRFHYFARAGGRTYYFDGYPTDPELWVTAGSPDDARPLLQGRTDLIPRVTELAALGDHVFFLAFDPEELRTELWRSDGTTEGTGAVVAFAATGINSQSALERTVIASDDVLYFTLWTDQGIELWSSDGTAAGTRRVAGLPQPAAPLRHPELVVHAGRASFVHDDGEHGAELWHSDGTEDGTRLVADLLPGPDSSYPQHLTALGDRLYFTADSPHGREPWALAGLPTCAESAEALCLSGGRFRVEVAWADFEGGTGAGRTTELRTDDTGAFWFFDPDNVELLVKVLDGRAINGHHWVFFGALSNVELTLRVTDTLTGARREYHNPSGRFASAGDTTAFATGGGGESAATPRRIDAIGAAPAGAECSAGAAALCLQDGRFRVEMEWTDFEGGTGQGTAVPVSPDTGAFWFFDDGNLELLVKVLDGRAINGRFWVFFGSTSNVGFRLTVTDTETGAQRFYENEAGTFASRGDTEAF